MIGPGTEALQARLPALIRSKLMEPYGMDVTIVFPSNANGEYGVVTAQGYEVGCRAALIPASAAVRAAAAAAGSGLPIPAFEFYVLSEDIGAAPLTVPGWYVRAGGLRYYPSGDVRDEGSQGVVYSVTLTAPGEVGTDGYPTQPGWTG